MDGIEAGEGQAVTCLLTISTFTAKVESKVLLRIHIVSACITTAEMTA